jgi:hypothetical protein
VCAVVFVEKILKADVAFALEVISNAGGRLANIRI